MSDILVKKNIIDKYLSSNEILGSNEKKSCSNIDLITFIAYKKCRHQRCQQKRPLLTNTYLSNNEILGSNGKKVLFKHSHLLLMKIAGIRDVRKKGICCTVFLVLGLRFNQQVVTSKQK